MDWCCERVFKDRRFGCQASKSQTRNERGRTSKNLRKREVSLRLVKCKKKAKEQMGLSTKDRNGKPITVDVLDEKYLNFDETDTDCTRDGYEV